MKMFQQSCSVVSGMRHVSRWQLVRVNRGSDMSTQHVNTEEQIADILTKGSFTTANENDLVRLVNIGAP